MQQHIDCCGCLLTRFLVISFIKCLNKYSQVFVWVFNDLLQSSNVADISMIGLVHRLNSLDKDWAQYIHIR